MNSMYPTSIGNIPLETWEMVRAISVKSGSDTTEVLRRCVVAGSLIELIKVGPDNEAGEYSGFTSAYLALLARCVLGTPIDFLLETGQHPYQPALTMPDPGTGSPAPRSSSPGKSAASFLLDPAIVDELEKLGVGGSFASGWVPD